MPLAPNRAALSHYVRMNHVHLPVFLDVLETVFAEGVCADVRCMASC